MSQPDEKTDTGRPDTAIAAQGQTDPTPVSDSLKPQLLAGAATALLLFGGFGGWAATAPLSGAVLAAGTVVVDSKVKKVQHPSGGVVGEIRVREGDAVKAGALLIRLDSTLTRANLAIVSGQLDELEIRKARLVAERDNAARMALPTALARRLAEPAVREIFDGEERLLESRRTGRVVQKQQLRERILQLEQEITGLTAQSSTKAREIELIGEELVGLRELLKKKLVPSLKVTAVERESVRLAGERAQLASATAQARGKITEIELQVGQIDRDLKSQVMDALRETQARIAELNERRIAAEDLLSRIDIRSPHAGIVHQLSVHTIGGVINRGDTIMQIVPQGEELVIEARLAPQDIDLVRVGQTAFVRFPAFNQKVTPELTGRLSLVGADLSKDAQSDRTWFLARIALPKAELRRIGELKPGMPAEIQIRTGERTALSYLMKPLSDQIARAFKEQ